jgi:hypothetical protein
MSSLRFAALRLATSCCGGLEARQSPRAKGGPWRATLEGPKGVFRGCAPEGPALKWRPILLVLLKKAEDLLAMLE